MRRTVMLVSTVCLAAAVGLGGALPSAAHTTAGRATPSNDTPSHPWPTDGCSTSWVAPDILNVNSIPGVYNFRHACVHHDGCYKGFPRDGVATHWVARETCDSWFLYDMQASCRERHGPHPRNTWAGRQCMQWAANYYYAVRELGAGAYRRPRARIQGTTRIRWEILETTNPSWLNPVGTVGYDTYSFTPNCVDGSCDTDLEANGRTFVLQPRRLPSGKRIYFATGNSLVPCTNSSGTLLDYIPVSNRILVTTPRVSSQNVARSIRGEWTVAATDYQGQCPHNHRVVWAFESVGPFEVSPPSGRTDDSTSATGGELGPADRYLTAPTARASGSPSPMVLAGRTGLPHPSLAAR